MSDKSVLLHETEQAFTELQRAVQGLDEDAMRRAWLGTWGVREILIHISGWHREMIPGLARVARGEPMNPAGTYDDFDAWNARFVDRKAGVKTVDVLAELEASHRAFVTAAAALPEPLFETARDTFDGAGAGHYKEHTAQILEWRKTAA